ncbi:MAG: MFS transporter [Pseudomonadota bacterium]
MRPSIEPGAALAGLSLAMLMPSLAASSANAALPALAQAFAASFQAAQWIVLAYLLAITIVIVVAGQLGDRIGRRRLLLAGIALFTGSSLLCGLAPTLALLVAARGVQGLGAAVMMALTITFVGDLVPRARMGRAMGLLGTMSAVGTTLGPSLGGVLVASSGWQAIFLLNVPLGVLAFAIVRRALPADRRPERRGLDGTGIMLWVSLFQNPGLRTGLATNALVSTVVMATLVVGPFYLSGALGLGAAAVGLVLSAGPLVAALAGVPAGRLVDRFGTGTTGIGGLVAMTTGSLALSLIPHGAGIAGYVVPITVLTAGYAMFQAANNTAVMADAPSGQRGVVSGMLTLSRNLGLMTGASAMGAVFAFGVGADVVTALPEAIAAGMRATFAVAAVLVVLALALAIAGQKKGRHPKAPPEKQGCWTLVQNFMRTPKV